jgi:hypothetical protein
VVVLRPLRTAAWTQSTEEVYRYPVVVRRPYPPSRLTWTKRSRPRPWTPPSSENLPKMTCTHQHACFKRSQLPAPLPPRVIFTGACSLPGAQFIGCNCFQNCSSIVSSLAAMSHNPVVPPPPSFRSVEFLASHVLKTLDFYSTRCRDPSGAA